ncbi:MAG TPA: hypothetical protein VGD98_18485 [Ktedonobacteraceae bacterium]
MITPWKSVTRPMALSLVSLFFVLLLAACGGGSSSTNTATPIPTVAPTPTPTVAPTQAAQFQIYKGAGFTIDYPQGWKAQTNQGAVVFTDAQQIDTVTIATIPNPGGAVSAADELKTGMSALEQSGGVSNIQPVSLPATTTISGESWAQSGITGMAKVNGALVPGELVGLADNHPANLPTTKAYEIYYAGPSLNFQQTDITIFQPMLQSFKFTA